ncbi:MAG: hypothetical protein Q4D06_09590 [Coriobacteriia bacterium]|nr:hypothetical protein [Coriobacteriia bacterium]
MGSKKRSAWAKQAKEFKDGLGGGGWDAGSDDWDASGLWEPQPSSALDDLFAQEGQRKQQAARERDEARREKACASKNRYRSHDEAQAAIRSCADYGRGGLSAYKCSYCNGWHLTSHPWKD